MSDNFDLGGGGSKSFSFGPQGSQPGASVTGTVIDMAEVQQINFDTKKPEFWDNGDPKMQHRLTLATDLRDPYDTTDDGKRDVYLRGRKRPHDNGAKSTICAVLDAVRAATGGTQLARGGRVTLTWVSGMGFSGDPRNYEATYVPPAMDLGAQGGQQQAQPAQQVQQQVAQPPTAPPPGWAQPAQQQQAQAAPPPAQPVAQAPAEQGQQVQLPPGVQMTPELQAALAAANTQPQG